LPYSDNEDVLNTCQKFQENLKKLKIPHSCSDISDYVTMSIGIVTLEPETKFDANNFIKIADEALYKAKRNGRNRIEVSTLE
jgi:diguanylate cyclase (GGDEF)-like protein